MRSELEKLRLHCDVILPAEAERKGAELKARGQAAPTVENGKATAEAIRMLVDEWATAGKEARDIYLLQQLDVVVAAAVNRVSSMTVEELEVVDGGDAESLSAVASAYSVSVARVLEETGRAMGIDVRALVSGVPTTKALPVIEDGPRTLPGGTR